MLIVIQMLSVGKSKFCYKYEYILSCRAKSFRAKWRGYLFIASVDNTLKLILRYYNHIYEYYVIYLCLYIIVMKDLQLNNYYVILVENNTKYFTK